MSAKYWRVLAGIRLAIIIIIIIISIIIVAGNLIRLKYEYVVCIEQNIKLRHLGWLKSSSIYFFASSRIRCWTQFYAVLWNILINSLSIGIVASSGLLDLFKILCAHRGLCTLFSMAEFHVVKHMHTRKSIVQITASVMQAAQSSTSFAQKRLNYLTDHSMVVKTPTHLAVECIDCSWLICVWVRCRIDHWLIQCIRLLRRT